MGKIMCICGHTITDQTDGIPYKSYILPDTHLNNITTSLESFVDALVDSIKSNKRSEWIRENFQGYEYPTDLKDSTMIHDLLLSKLVKTTQNIFECERCGRIAIQLNRSNEYKFFSPETDANKGILKG